MIILILNIVIISLNMTNVKAEELSLKEYRKNIEKLNTEIADKNNELNIISSNIEEYKKENFEKSKKSLAALNEANGNKFLLFYNQKINTDYISIYYLENLEKQKETLIKEIENIKIEILDIEKYIEENRKITYDSNDLRKSSNATLEELSKALEGTALYELAPAFLKAEEDYNVNAFFLIGLCALESDWGRSQRAVNDNNLTGFGVNSDDSVGINDNSKENNIMRTAKWIGEEYLSENGLYYNGTKISDVNKKYCVNPEWSNHITNIVHGIIDDFDNISFQ